MPGTRGSFKMSDRSTRRPVVAIVGGGFSGAAAAFHLLSSAHCALEIVVVEPATTLGRGLAYSTSCDSHCLNVPAGRLGLDPAHEAGFIDWLQARGERHVAASFVPRRLLGDYVGSELSRAIERAPLGSLLRHVRGRVESLVRDGDGFELRLSDGSRRHADLAILATGHLPPAPPGHPAAIDWTQAGLVPDPRRPEALANLAPAQDVLLVGSGLTAVDVVLQLADAGHVGRVHLLSRRGLLPQPHRVNEIRPATIASPALDEAATLRQMLAAVRTWIAQHTAAGGDWRDAMASLRASTPALWQRLDVRDRRRFLRHLQPFWDSHRHRLAAALHQRVQALRGDGRLTVRAGRLAGVEHLPDGRLRAAWHPRGGGPAQYTDASRIVNCTGPAADVAQARAPLLASLRDAGLLRPDPLGQGLLVDDALQVLDAAGHAVAGLFHVGPMLKAQRWEAVAIPELRLHARDVARRILESLAGG